MIETLAASQGNILGLGVSGKLTEEDYQGLIPQVEGILKEHGSIRMLIVFEDLKGITAKAAWMDLKFDMKHHKQYERLAVVGENRLEEVIAWFSKPFVKGEVKYFDRDQVEQAWEWIKQD